MVVYPFVSSSDPGSLSFFSYYLKHFHLRLHHLTGRMLKETITKYQHRFQYCYRLYYELHLFTVPLKYVFHHFISLNLPSVQRYEECFTIRYLSSSDISKCIHLSLFILLTILFISFRYEF